MISTGEAIRLLRNIVGEIGEHHGDPANHFRWMMGEGGVQFTPDLDLQDIATLARIYAGEGIESPDGSAR